MTPSTIPPLETYSLKSAAEAAGVSISTVRRRKEALINAGASITDRGWKIPEAALRAVFELAPETVSDTSQETPTDTPVETLLIAQLKSEVEFLRGQVDQQARTIERQAEAHAVIAGQLARLELEQTPETHSKEEEQQEEPEQKRRWWQRR